MKEIEKSIREGFDMIDKKAWIAVVPQILARIDIEDEKIRNCMLDLLGRIGEYYPQALIYPLSLLEKSKTRARRTAAQHLIK